MYLHQPPLTMPKRILIVGLLSFTVSACGWWKKTEIDTETLTAEELYGNAKESMLNERWPDAVTKLQQLEARYPYGEFAIQAQLDTVYAHYRNNNNGLAIAAADRFLSINPTHSSADYAYYIKGLANYDEEDRLIGVITGRINLADRDQKSIVSAISAFNTILRNYPDSQYAFDASKRIVYLESALAEYEITVARFYYQRGAYVAAVNRCKTTLENYVDGPQVEDALGIMLFSYQKMGLQDLAADTNRVLATNYPNSGYLNASSRQKKVGGGGLRKAFNSLFN